MCNAVVNQQNKAVPHVETLLLRAVMFELILAAVAAPDVGKKARWLQVYLGIRGI